MSSAADLLENFPFVRDITPLDFIHLPKGLFEALPKPCNMKRSAASAGPIWPPVLTNVLLNGLLIIHHKPHLVGKPGLDEHYNWLSAFIYRQTRGWDTSALARNTIEIQPALPGNRQLGIIRNRKQISSKVQTIGEYLKDTHWAYVTQGPKPAKDLLPTVQRLGCDELSLTAPIFGPSGSAGDSSPTLVHPPDLSQVSLEPTWLPPTPFSLPATPNHSHFSYPDVTDYEMHDARILGYEPAVWREFADRLSVSRHHSTPLTLDVYSMAPYVQPTVFGGSFRLTSASISIHFGGSPPNTEDISPHLLTGCHQLASLDPSSVEDAQSIQWTSLDISHQQVIQTLPPYVPTYQVDLPIHLPTSTADRTYLFNEVGCDYHVKARIGLSTDSIIPPVDDSFQAVSEVYFFSGVRKQNVELLEQYEEAAPVRCDKGGPAGSLVAHALAASFAAKIWADVIERRQGIEPDLSRYLIVQKITPRSSKGIPTKPCLIIVYSPRLSSQALPATKKHLIRDEFRDDSSPTSETDMEMDSTPRPYTDEPGNPGPSAGYPANRSAQGDNKDGTGNNYSGGKAFSKASLRRSSPLLSGSTGPIRNSKVLARNQSSTPSRITAATTNTTPPPIQTKFPLTPNPSPGNPNIGRRDEKTPSPLQTDMAQINSYHSNQIMTPGLTTIQYSGDWTALLPSAIGSAMEAGYATPPGHGWPYDSPELARISVQTSMPTAHFGSYPFQAGQPMGFNNVNEHPVYYGTNSVGSWH